MTPEQIAYIEETGRRYLVAIKKLDEEFCGISMNGRHPSYREYNLWPHGNPPLDGSLKNSIMLELYNLLTKDAIP